MDVRERRTLRGIAIALLVASAARLAWDHRALPPVLPALGDSADLLPGLLAASESLAAEADLRSRRLLPGETIDPNSATSVEWDRLPGIGAVTADRIVRTRDSLGGFRAVADLTAVPGIGERTLDELRPFLSVPSADPRSSPPGRTGDGVPPVDLNRATEAELMTLPGIGPALASRILESRSRDGPFRSVDELRRVRGIGPVVLEGLRSRVGVSGR